MSVEEDFKSAAGPEISLVGTEEFDRGRRTQFTFTYRRNGVVKTANVGTKHDGNFAKRAGEMARNYAEFHGRGRQ